MVNKDSQRLFDVSKQQRHLEIERSGSLRTQIFFADGLTYVKP